MTLPVNIGPGTAPETFVLARNAWYCLDAPERSRPRLPIPEAEGIAGLLCFYSEKVDLTVTDVVEA